MCNPLALLGLPSANDFVGCDTLRGDEHLCPTSFRSVCTYNYCCQWVQNSGLQILDDKLIP